MNHALGTWSSRAATLFHVCVCTIHTSCQFAEKLNSIFIQDDSESRRANHKSMVRGFNAAASNTLSRLVHKNDGQLTEYFYQKCRGSSEPKEGKIIKKNICFNLCMLVSWLFSIFWFVSFNWTRLHILSGETIDVKLSWNISDLSIDKPYASPLSQFHINRLTW